MICTCLSDHTKIHATSNSKCTRTTDYDKCYQCYYGHHIVDTDNDPFTGTDENDLSRKYEAEQERIEYEGNIG